MISKRNIPAFLLGFLVCLLYSSNTLAGIVVATGSINELAANMGDSVASLPGLMAAMCYLSGILMAVLALFKTIDHVTNPTQTPIRVPIIRYLIGGMLFSLPIVIEAAAVTINGGSVNAFGPVLGAISVASGVGMAASYLSFGTFSSILGSIIYSTINLPSLVAVVAYLLGILIAISALYKTRDHVEDPDRVPLKDAVIRYITAGLLLALPATFEAMYNTLTNGGLGVLSIVSEAFILSGFFTSSLDGGWFGGFACGLSALIPGPIAAFLPGGSTLGNALCTTLVNVSALPIFLTFLSYMLGLVFGLWSIFKIRDHVLNPSQTTLSDGIMKMIAAACFFGLPMVSMSIVYSVTPNVGALGAVIGITSGMDAVSDAATQTACTTGTVNGLANAMGCFMIDILAPMHTLINFFCYSAGLIFIMIGTARLTKSAQEGARGPGGIGTITTFVVGGALMSATTIMKAVSTSFTGNLFIATDANLTYTAGMSLPEQQAAYTVINAVLRFMMIVGLISFVRGIFILRDVSEGGQQASVMSGMTHIIGGALAVNLGTVINLVQATLGITAFGVTFT